MAARRARAPAGRENVLIGSTTGQGNQQHGGARAAWALLAGYGVPLTEGGGT